MGKDAVVLRKSHAPSVSDSASVLLLQVILILTKYYHADSTKVLESSLWR